VAEQMLWIGKDLGSISSTTKKQKQKAKLNKTKTYCGQNGIMNQLKNYSLLNNLNFLLIFGSTG
jgi:hypothetical protein